MKSKIKFFLIAIAGLGIIFSGAAFASNPGGQGWWRNNPDERSWGGERYYFSSGRLASDICYRAKIETLSDLSGKSVETVKNDMLNKPRCLLLEEYKIKASDFYASLKAKKIDLLKKAVNDKQITEEEKGIIMDRINSGRGRGRGYGPGRGRGYGPGRGRGYGPGYFCPNRGSGWNDDSGWDNGPGIRR